MTNRTYSCRDDSSRGRWKFERRSFLPGWITNQSLGIRMSINASVRNAFEYRSHHDGYTYEFRGSIQTLREDLSQLRRYHWIDHRTNTMEIEMSLYNPNIQMFTSVILSAEVLSMHYLIPTAQIDPVDLQSLFLDQSAAIKSVKTEIFFREPIPV